MLLTRIQSDLAVDFDDFSALEDLDALELLSDDDLDSPLDLESDSPFLPPPLDDEFRP